MKLLVRKFSDGQVHTESSAHGVLVVSVRGNSYSDLFEAASIKDAWDSRLENRGLRSELQIACLIGQRSDRRFNCGGSFDLKVIARFINSMGFSTVRILDPHSDVTCALIENSTSVTPLFYVEKAYRDIGTQPILISPDAGAYKKVHGIAANLKADLVPANKVRLDGNPVIQIQGDVEGRDCLIVDDIADGGRTFIELTKKLKKSGAKSVYLYVTHGMFNYGFNEVNESIDRIYCTNSFKEIENDRVTQYECLR